MSQHIYNIWLAVQDGWQNVALIVLIGERIMHRRLVDRTLRAIERETADGTI